MFFQDIFIYVIGAQVVASTALALLGEEPAAYYNTFTGQAVGGDSRKTFSAHVTEGGAGVGAGVPVMHPWEMFHIKLGHLETKR